MTPAPTQRDAAIAATLTANEYNQDRLIPQPGAQFYLHLADLRLALGGVATTEPVLLLDYGCGGSPYRSLFPNAKYLRADFEGSGDVDFDIVDSRVPNCAAESCDIVLSTQVLEHVARPEVYLSEAVRILRPGGRLILSTHGMFEEHGCPYDYHRWTVDGLRNILERSGFIVERLERLTTGPRAILFMLDQGFVQLRAPHSTAFGFGLALFRWLYARWRRVIHSQADKYFASDRIAAESDSSKRAYICLLATCYKGNAVCRDRT